MAFELYAIAQTVMAPRNILAGKKGGANESAFKHVAPRPERE